jgi:hypothetical protein
MVSAHEIGGKTVIYLKGAFETVLDIYCAGGSVAVSNAAAAQANTTLLTAETSSTATIPLTPGLVAALHAEAAAYGQQSYRVIAIAELVLNNASSVMDTPALQALQLQGMALYSCMPVDSEKLAVRCFTH